MLALSLACRYTVLLYVLERCPMLAEFVLQPSHGHLS